MRFIKRFPILTSIIFSELLGFLFPLYVVFRGIDYANNVGELLPMTVYLTGFMGTLLVYPCVLTLINIVTLFWRKPEARWLRKEKQFEYITFVLGILYSMLYLIFMSIDVRFDADWQVQLYNSEIHAPIWTEAYLTVAVAAIVGLLGYLILSIVRVRRTPPLVTVLAMAGMYIGIGVSALWIIQFFTLDNLSDWPIVLFPFNFILMAIKTIRYKIAEWNEQKEEENRAYEEESLNQLALWLEKAERWPLIAFLLMWPLLGIMICILVLFGQRPDALIKAWTETSDWNLSQRVAPQNIYYDEHYLCTVAAGGHEKVVKPLRMGVRHGHSVIVNRQLCIANAFEQILEERTPTLHRHIRHFYDTYGFPIAKAIKSPYIADIIYVLMKPLEWIFLAVIYFCDVHPEDRIAVQYLPKMKENAEMA